MFDTITPKYATITDSLHLPGYIVDNWLRDLQKMYNNIVDYQTIARYCGLPAYYVRTDRQNTKKLIVTTSKHMKLNVWYNLKRLISMTVGLQDLK
jgi:hypothetical protein